MRHARKAPGDIQGPVGASLLAKNPRAPRTFWMHALSLKSFAGKLAPTGVWHQVAGRMALIKGCNE
ncbi:hypothetical protein FIV36_16050 [Pseudomonas extremaustralis]|uniref:Uncharacterized protein n=1 Tax=Pseudomonas extremaustralis TaxID=359110 RepID=A0A5C5QE88_9PSED|nr:hypothetical protein FIV36_16050 [Pseudomonas extremaustralis]